MTSDTKTFTNLDVQLLGVQFKPFGKFPQLWPKQTGCTDIFLLTCFTGRGSFRNEKLHGAGAELFFFAKSLNEAVQDSLEVARGREALFR